MKLLVDSDAFCKLAKADLFVDAAGLLGASLAECSRLPALSYMLKRGGLRIRLGPETCDALMATVEAMPVLLPPSDTWLAKLTSVEAIDPGEAQLFAAAADNGVAVLSGDKRALRAVKAIEGFPEALSGRIVTLEAILWALCDHVGAEVVRRHLSPVMGLDTMISVCFSRGNSAPIEALKSYHQSFAEEVKPLVLWAPRHEESK